MILLETVMFRGHIRDVVIVNYGEQVSKIFSPSSHVIALG